VPNTIDVGAGSSQPVDLAAARADFGLILNYDLYASTETGWDEAGTAHSLAGRFEGRMLGPYGVISSTALAQGNFADRWGDAGEDFVRLDSSWRYTDAERAVVYQVGDGIAGSLPWSSSYRFGGIQIRRNFDIRPDLVTTPSPSLAGSAAVPSTLDLYLNNIRVYSGAVPAGPFDFAGLPVLGGGGDARIVMEDELGRETVVERAYYFAPDMLGAGLFDFSAELGYARLGYGDRSFDYDSDLVGSASVRYGLSNLVTLEGHVEGTRDLVNGGVGAVASLGRLGVLRGSFAVSRFAGDDSEEVGGKASAFYQIARNGYSLYAGIDRMFGDYNDVGLVVDRKRTEDIPLSARAREVLRAGISFPLGFDDSALSLGYTRTRGDRADDNAQIVSASWSRTIFDNVSVFATGYGDLERRNEFGIFAGLTVSFGDNLTASSSVSSTDDRLTYDASVSKTAQLEEGSLGWTLRGRRSGSETGGSASASYRTGLADFGASVEQSGRSSRASGSVSGSVVAAGGDVFLANRVDDGFAIVKGGGPNVDVLLNSTRIAKTNSRGRAFVPNLQPYQNNKVSIDPTNLSLDLQPQETDAIVVPADQSGAVVDFGVTKVEGAVIILTGGDGAPLAVGSVVELEGGDEPTVVGYDGRTYLGGLRAKNSITVTLPAAAGTCSASFEFQPVEGEQVEIGPVPCS
jgi:outer membrane usher protein